MVFRNRWAALGLIGLVLVACQNNLLFQPVAPTDVEETLKAVKLRGIWVIGGQNTPYNLGYPTAAGVIAQVDLYDPETNTWYPDITRLPLPVTFAGAASYGGKIYVSGGWDSRGVVRNELQIFDVIQNRWSFGAIMPEPRAYHDLILLDEYFYASAGVNTNHDATFNPRYQYFRYDPSLNSWAPRLAFGNINSTITLAGGIIRAMGGRSTSTAIQNYHDGYFATPTSPTDTTTTGTTEIPIARMFGGAVSLLGSDLAGYILYFGGINANLGGTWRAFVFHDLTSNNSILTNTIFYLKAPYEAPSNWTAAPASLNQALAFHRAITYKSGVYVMGGSKNLPGPIATEENWFFNLSNFPAALPPPVAKSPMPVARYGHQLVRVVE